MYIIKSVNLKFILFSAFVALSTAACNREGCCTCSFNSPYNDTSFCVDKALKVSSKLVKDRGQGNCDCSF